MSVIPLTLFFSLVLTGLFIVLFAREQRRRRFTSSESDSLLPLAEERPRSVNLEHQEQRKEASGFPEPLKHARKPDSALDHTHDEEGHSHAGHDHDDASCGCRSGKKAPCPGCLKRPAQITSASTPL